MYPCPERILARILVVDDNESVRNVLKKGIERIEGGKFKVITTPNGEMAQELLRLYSFDLLITDLNMPGMNGMDLIEWVRDRRRMSGMDVILFTDGSVVPEGRDLHDFSEEWDVPVFTKPDSVLDILEFVKSKDYPWDLDMPE